MTKDEAPTKLGRYKIVRELGKGAMGVVYEGLDPVIGRRVAIKTARRDVMESSGRADELMERFLREARSAGSLNHRGIITIFDADIENGIAYIAMEFIDSGSLQDALTKKKRFSPEKVVEISAAICEALAEAHQAGIVHRDVKPANIMILPDGGIRVADFGIAYVSDSNLTQEGAMIGTPHFMSPEQFMGQKVDGRSDLFSLGVIMYELLTGEKPFGGEVLSTVMHRVIKVNPIEPKELNFAVTDCLSKVVMKALSKKPNDRYQTGREMAAALRESLKENPDPAITQVVLNRESAAPARESLHAATVVSEALPDGTPPGQSASVPDGLRGSLTGNSRPQGAVITNFDPTVTRPGKRKAMLVGIIGAVALIAFIAVVAVFFLGGGKTPATTTPTKGPTISKVDLTVWLFDTQEAYEAAKTGKDDSYSGAVKYDVKTKTGTANVKILDPDTGDVLADEKDVYMKIITLKRPAKNIKVVCSREGYTETSSEASAEVKPGTVPIVVLLKKK